MLEQERVKIDQLDREIVKLLEERFDVVEQIVQIKAENQLPILDASREVQVLDKIAGYVENPAYQETLVAIYQSMLVSSKEYQQKKYNK